MMKWLDEKYEAEVEVTGYLRGDKPEGLCRNGEEIGDKYSCTYGCPVDQDGYGICPKGMLMLHPLMKATGGTSVALTCMPRISYASDGCADSKEASRLESVCSRCLLG